MDKRIVDHCDVVSEGSVPFFDSKAEQSHTTKIITFRVSKEYEHRRCAHCDLGRHDTIRTTNLMSIVPACTLR